MGAVFAGIATSMSARFGGPFHPARVVSRCDPVLDDGGSVIPGADKPRRRSCQAQIDAVTESMRLQDGYTDKDVRIILLGLVGPSDTDDNVEVLAGPNAGLYSIETVDRDTAGLGVIMRGRPIC